ncbi:MJ1255/VC2487 family glycosyltransferase [Cellvibrio polysaccharolyticus]|uniref:Glycosyl transferase n=1 Tax=Cellvibrio polysaccharolyticus TaxID=2082724 RepID=A0A928V7Q7_9GAMM|nr:MJ1255/VC2487 family glycosyltransferase [Cellvibrio polysaccharolyticus]MBE8718059.1 glycosyl transferase [Cellvibrio polysaccharolyticus]
MKILYGVQATGNGHITRARIMAKALAAENINVDWVFSGREPDAFFDMEIFGHYRLFRGLTFVTRHGKVDYPRTLLKSDLLQLRRDINTLDVSGYDLIISDFEPVSAWAAKKAGKTSLGISHQSAFLHPVPTQGANLFTRGFMRFFAPVSQPIGLHWHHFQQAILPPMVENTGHACLINQGEILVYLPFASLEDFLPALRPINTCQFHVFHGDRYTGNLPAHIHLHPLSRDHFQQALHQCEGVICSAGFELPSEALHLGKKLLVQPVGGQMEQQSNALALQELGYAQVAQTLNAVCIRDWLATPQPDAKHFPDVAAALASWIKQADRIPLASLANTLWNAQKVTHNTQATRE